MVDKIKLVDTVKLITHFDNTQNPKWFNHKSSNKGKARPKPQIPPFYKTPSGANHKIKQ
jgi:hypothetical protein